MARELYTFGKKGYDRVARAVKKVEGLPLIKRPAGVRSASFSRNPPGADKPFVWVKMKGTMHHDKESATDSNRVRNFADDVVSVVEDEVIKIWPGWQKGIWFKGDVIAVFKFGEKWQPLSWGRQFFEATLNSSLSVNGNSTVTIGGETIEVVEGNFASANLTGKIGITLSHPTFTTGEAGVIWRATIAHC